MARGSSDAKTAAQTGQQFANTYSGNAADIFGTLTPMLTSEAAHPPGMSPMDISAADTSAQQSAGGSQGAALGQGLLRAARTRNLGGGDAATAAASRGASEALSSASLSTRLRNAALKESQRSEGVRGLEGLFGTNVSGGNQALGIVPSAVNANTQAENASWDWATDLFNPILNAAGRAARPG